MSVFVLSQYPLLTWPFLNILRKYFDNKYYLKKIHFSCKSLSEISQDRNETVQFYENLFIGFLILVIIKFIRLAIILFGHFHF